MDQLFSINLALVVFGLSWLEQRRYKRLLTPFTVSSWPFVIICLLTNFILVPYGFKSVSSIAIIFIGVNLILIWLAGMLILQRRHIEIAEYTGQNHQFIFADIARYHPIIVLIAWVIIIVNFRRIFSIINEFGGVWILADERFEKIMSHGLISHLVEIGKVCFLILIFSFRYSRYKWLVIATLAALFINTAAIMIKYHLIWLVVMSFLFIIVYEPEKIQFRRIIILSFLLFLVMNLFWIFLTIIWGTFSLSNQGVWEFLGKHFLNYLVSGPIVLDYWLHLGSIKPDWTLLVVAENMWNVLSGHPERIDAVPLVSHGFFEVASGVKSNVGTSFGVFYMIGGYAFTFAVTIIMSVIGYMLFYLSFVKNSKILVFMNILVLNLFLLNFFVQYFTVLSLYELCGIFILLIAAFRVSESIRLKINPDITAQMS